MNPAHGTVMPMVSPAAGEALHALAAAGATYAATAISQLVRGPAAPGDADTRLVTAGGAELSLGEGRVALATHIVIEEPVTGHLIMSVEEAAARRICDRLLGGRETAPERMRSVLEQVGSIASSAFIIGAGRACGFPLGSSIARVDSAQPRDFIRDVMSTASIECPNGVVASYGSPASGKFGLVVSRYSLPLLIAGADLNGSAA